MQHAVNESVVTLYSRIVNQLMNKDAFSTLSCFKKNLCSKMALSPAFSVYKMRLLQTEPSDFERSDSF